MKKLLIVLLVLAAWSSAQATTVAIVVNNNTSRSTIGVDTLLGDNIAATLGYTVHYRDLDSVFTPAAWDAFGYAVVIFPGYEVPGGGAAFTNKTPMADSVAKSNTPMMCMGNDFYNEINLGIGKADTTENTGYLINTNSSHWITKVFQDTVIFWGASAATQYLLREPTDSIHSVQILMSDKDYQTTGAVVAVAEAGATIINTGDNRNVANQRRVFFGLWQYQSQTPDSCQFYTLLNRCVAWVAGDTANAGILGTACLSGYYEIAFDGLAERNGTDTTKVYGDWGTWYVGQDHNEKHFYVKPTREAVARKFTNIYRSLTVGSHSIKVYIPTAGIAWDVTPPATWSQSWTLFPIIRRWDIGRTTGAYSTTRPFANLTYAYKDTAQEPDVDVAWGGVGASLIGTDVDDVYVDSLTITQATTVNQFFTLSLETSYISAKLLQPDSCFGYASRVLAYSYAEDDPGVEFRYYSPTFSTRSVRPVWNFSLSEYSTTLPMPSIAFLYDSLTMASTVGTNPSTDLYNHNNLVSNGSGGALSCVSVSDDAAWLTTTITGTDQTPFGITAVIDVTGLAAGYYSALVTVQCDDADNSPATFKVALTLTAGAPPPSVPKMSGYIR